MTENNELETPSEDKWRKILKQPLFNCCGDCPLVKRIEEMVKNSLDDEYDKSTTCEWKWGNDNWLGYVMTECHGPKKVTRTARSDEDYILCPFCGGVIKEIE